MKNNENKKSNSDSQKIQYKNVQEIPEALSIEELAIFLRISTSATYDLIKHENIKTQKCFSKKFISKNTILDFITHKRKNIIGIIDICLQKVIYLERKLN